MQDPSFKAAPEPLLREAGEPRRDSGLAALPTAARARTEAHRPVVLRLRNIDFVVWCLLAFQIAVLLAAAWVGA